MITDSLPADPEEKNQYLRSDALLAIELPPAAPLVDLSRQLEVAMKAEDRKEIQRLCNAISAGVSQSFGVKAAKVKVLGARPLEENGDMVDETFGDYDFETAVIRLWMRTAVLEKVTSFGTFLSTLCHEICHHLDLVYFNLPDTFHTRGFYTRAGQLYHHVRGTPARPLVWDRRRDGTYSINWPKTMQSGNRRRF